MKEASRQQKRREERERAKEKKRTSSVKLNRRETLRKIVKVLKFWQKDSSVTDEERRRVLKRLAGAGISLGAAAVGIGTIVSSNREEKEPPTASPSSISPDLRVIDPTEDLLNDTELIAKTDELIAKIERGFKRFEAKALPKIEAVPSDWLKNELLGPFTIFNENLSNPNKNTLGHSKELKARGQETFIPDKAEYFGYIARRLYENTPAAFSVMDRTMLLSPDIDPKSMFDMLILYHELAHVSQDTIARSELPWETYKDFSMLKPGEKPRTIIDYEVHAYARQLELANLLLNDQLRQLAISGEPIGPHMGRLFEAMGVDISKYGAGQQTIEFSQIYFPEGMVDGQPSQKFFDAMIAHHRNIHGTELYRLNPSGVLEKI